MGRMKLKKLYAVCQNAECDNEFSFVPSRKKKYCSQECFHQDPELKKKKRSALKHFFAK